jgi:probable dihydroxyacetone kinase regulator
MIGNSEVLMKKNSTLSCSEVTKLNIAHALKDLMETKQFEKITVSDITNKCGIHRQTFYYHFQDRYELLDWLLYKELVSQFTNGFSIDTMYDKFNGIFETIYNNKKFYQNALKINISEVSKYISSVSTEEFTRVICEIGKKNGVEPNSVDDKLIAEFFGYGLSGVVASWVSRGMKETPKEMTEKIEKFFIVSKKLITDGNI